MATLFRLTAICLGLLNVCAIGLVGDTAYLGYMDVARSPATLLLWAICAAVAGLMASEIVLRSVRSVLWGNFALRYAGVVLTMCLSGVISGVLISVGELLRGSFGLADHIGLFLMSGAVGALFGGQLGFLEGLVLAFPLAALLGLFRGRD